VTPVLPANHRRSHPSPPENPTPPRRQFLAGNVHLNRSISNESSISQLLQPTHCKTLAFGTVQVHKEGVLGANSRTKQIRKDFIANPSQTLHLESMNARVLPSLCRLALPVLVAAALHPASAQNATTIPVGYILANSQNSTSSIGTVPPDTDVDISLPLKRPVVFASAVDSVSGSAVTVQNATFAANQLTTTPHLLEIASGSGEGVSALISSHNATTCTVDLPNGLTLNGVVNGDSVRIRKAWTVGDFFTNATVPVGTLVLISGGAAGINLPVDILLEWDGADWQDAIGGSGPANNTVIYHGENFTVRNISTVETLSNMILVGEVPSYKFKAPLANLNPSNDQDIPIAYVSPVPEILGNSSISASAQPGDLLLVKDNSTTGQNKPLSALLEFDGVDWQDAIGGSGPVTDTFVILPGSGMTYRRLATANGTVWDQEPTYLPLP